VQINLLLTLISLSPSDWLIDRYRKVGISHCGASKINYRKRFVIERVKIIVSIESII
jgi:hypothetical protein